MKKIFLALICFLGLALSVDAHTIEAKFVAREDGERIGRIELHSNGTCLIVNEETGERQTGTYNIERAPEPGDVCSIYFDLEVDGSYRGVFMWGLEDGQMINFSNIIFKRN